MKNTIKSLLLVGLITGSFSTLIGSHRHRQSSNQKTLKPRKIDVTIHNLTNNMISLGLTRYFNQDFTMEPYNPKTPDKSQVHKITYTRLNPGFNIENVKVNDEISLPGKLFIVPRTNTQFNVYITKEKNNQLIISDDKGNKNILTVAGYKELQEFKEAIDAIKKQNGFEKPSAWNNAKRKLVPDWNSKFKKLDIWKLEDICKKYKKDIQKYIDIIDESDIETDGSDIEKSLKDLDTYVSSIDLFQKLN